MTTICYARVANKECISEGSQADKISQKRQAELAKAYAEKQGFKVVNTGSSQLHAKILALVQHSRRNLMRR